MIDLYAAARAIYYSNIDAGIESVYAGPWDELPSYAKNSYLNIAGAVLSALKLSYTASEQNADHS